MASPFLSRMISTAMPFLIGCLVYMAAAFDDGTNPTPLDVESVVFSAPFHAKNDVAPTAAVKMFCVVKYSASITEYFQRRFAVIGVAL